MEYIYTNDPWQRFHIAFQQETIFNYISVFYEQRLLKTLLKDYNPRARPVSDPDDKINVTISFHLTKVVGLVWKSSNLLRAILKDIIYLF